MFKNLITIILFVITFPAFSQGIVQGKIVDSNTNEPLIGASVRVLNTNFGAAADVNGSFEIKNVSVGKQTLEITFVGYDIQKVEIQVEQGKITDLTLKLSESFFMGEEVVVSATRRPEKLTEAPAAMSIITAKEISQNSSLGLIDMYSKMQGIEFSRQGVNSVTLNARGFNSAFNAKVLNMTDGRISMTAGSTGLPAIINNTYIKEDVERVEVVFGPNSALYGPNAHNGVMQVLTKDPRSSAGTIVAIGAGNQNVLTARLRHAQILNNKFSFKVMGEYTAGKDFEFYDSVYVGGSPYTATQYAVPEKNDNFNFKHLRASASLYYSLNKDSDLILSYGGSLNDYFTVNSVGRNRSKNMNFQYFQLRYVSPRLFAQIYYTTTDLGNDSYNLQNYTRDYTNRVNSPYTQDSPLFANFGKLSPEQAEVFARRSKLNEQSARLNGEIQYNYSFEKTGTELIASASYQKDLPNTNGTILLDATQKVEITQTGVALQMTQKLPANMRFIASARYDNHSVFGNLFAPKLALVWNGLGGSIRASYGQALAAPIILFQYIAANGVVFGSGDGISYVPNGASLTDQTAIKTIDKLKVERVQTFEMGYKGIINKKLFLDFNGWYAQSENFLSPAISVGGRILSMGSNAINFLVVPGAANAQGNLAGGLFQTYFNYGNVNSYGVDLGANYFFNDNISLGIKYSYFDSDITKDDIKNDANRDGYVSLEERSLNAPKNRIVSNLGFNNLIKNKLSASISMRWLEAYDFYAGSQIGTAAGEGKRGAVYGGKVNGTDRFYVKNFDWGSLGGFTTFDLNLTYKINEKFNFGASVSNIFDTKQKEFVGSPAIRRLFMVEFKVNLPAGKK
ncbi:MAG: TonB-dependent receptor [Bacteroidetes bacterium]|nr:MAG: TonB-dependent receptor [Bacteroidota bacterium]